MIFVTIQTTFFDPDEHTKEYVRTCRKALREILSTINRAKPAPDCDDFRELEHELIAEALGWIECIAEVTLKASTYVDCSSDDSKPIAPLWVIEEEKVSTTAKRRRRR